MLIYWPWKTVLFRWIASRPGHAWCSWDERMILGLRLIEVYCFMQQNGFNSLFLLIGRNGSASGLQWWGVAYHHTFVESSTMVLSGEVFLLKWDATGPSRTACLLFAVLENGWRSTLTVDMLLVLASVVASAGSRIILRLAFPSTKTLRGGSSCVDLIRRGWLFVGQWEISFVDLLQN